MTAYTSHTEEVREVRSTRERIANLLKGYPHVSDKDRKEILQFMKEARHLEVGLLTANDSVRPQLDEFMKDHKRHFKVNITDLLRAGAVLGLVLMVCWLVWELFMPVSI